MVNSAIQRLSTGTADLGVPHLTVVSSETPTAAADDEWLEGIELYSTLSGPIAELSHLRRSLLFAELAQIAYMPAPQAKVCALRIGFRDAELFDRDGAQAYRFENEHDCVIACRGTQPTEWNDVKADADAVMAAAETVGRVHRGFKTEVDDLWPMIEARLVRTTKPVWFTGHSLGGAMAVICAARCALSHIDAMPQGLFTYGSPRVGDRQYVRHVALDHSRWVNNNDIVTRLPPAIMGFRHCGTEHYIDSRGRVSRMSGWRRVLDRVRGFVLGLGRLSIDHFSDHSIDGYVEHIHRAVVDAERRALGEDSTMALEFAT